MERENCVLIVAGPSGVGKTVIAEQMVRNDPRFTFLRSGTTRARRGDSHDDEYLYYTEEDFLSAVERGEFAEHMRYGNHLYGTPKSELYRAFSEGKIPLLVLDLVGVESMAHLPEYSACSVYIYADIDVIDSRLRGRYLSGEPTEKNVSDYKRRIEENNKDFGNIGKYGEYIFSFVRNESTVEDCSRRVAEVFHSFVRGAEKSTAEVAKAISLISSFSK